MKRLNCRVVTDSPYRMSNYTVYSDVSATGCGAHPHPAINGEQVCNKQWDLEERREKFYVEGVICHIVRFTFIFTLTYRLLCELLF